MTRIKKKKHCVDAAERLCSLVKLQIQEEQSLTEGLGCVAPNGIEGNCQKKRYWWGIKGFDKHALDF